MACSPVSKAKDFALFKVEFQKWQKKFGLTGYKIKFCHAPIDDAYAYLDARVSAMVATVTLNSTNTILDYRDRSIKALAKHEAIHLLLSRANDVAYKRWASKDEMYESMEELTVRLEDLIT